MHTYIIHIFINYSVICTFYINFLMCGYYVFIYLHQEQIKDYSIIAICIILLYMHPYIVLINFKCNMLVFCIYLHILAYYPCIFLYMFIVGSNQRLFNKTAQSCVSAFLLYILTYAYISSYIHIYYASIYSSLKDISTKHNRYKPRTIQQCCSILEP